MSRTIDIDSDDRLVGSERSDAYSVKLEISARGAPSVTVATAALSQREIRNLVRDRLEAAKLQQ